MAWIRLNVGEEFILNLEHYFRIEMCPGDGYASWQVQAVAVEGRHIARTRLFGGTKPECEAVVDEIAKLVWAAVIPDIH